MAVFGRGNPDTDELCRTELTRFAMQEHRADQFEMVKEIIRDSLWPALVAKFGFPTLQSTGQGGSDNVGKFNVQCRTMQPQLNNADS